MDNDELKLYVLAGIRKRFPVAPGESAATETLQVQPSLEHKLRSGGSGVATLVPYVWRQPEADRLFINPV